MGLAGPCGTGASEGITPWRCWAPGRNDSPPMNEILFRDIPPEEQLELFDIVPDTPLPPPHLLDDPADEPHMEWLKRQSEDGLRIFLQILENTPGFRRS